MSQHAVASPPSRAARQPAGFTVPEEPMGDQLDALLGEHLMPLRARTPGRRDEPYLLAVDAAGQPVVVEVVPVLDEAAVIRALGYAGRAARMSTADLAAAYRGGPERFASHLAAFRLTVPATALLSTFVRGGARLLLVCSHISPGVADVLEFLLQPGWQVDVLHAHVVTEPDGQRVVELSPVARPTPPRRDFDPPPWAREREDPLFDPTPLFRSTPVRRSTRALTPDAPLGPTDPPADLRAPAPTTASRAPAPAAAPSAVPGGAAARPAPAVVPPSFAVPVTPGKGTPIAVDPVLAALGEVLEGPAPLVWAPDAHGPGFEAMLRADGVIELADGSRFGDLEEATRAVSGVVGPLDVWQVWHVDSATGPTLAELAAVAFPDQF
jgi:hypothetical protein